MQETYKSKPIHGLRAHIAATVADIIVLPFPVIVVSR